MKLIISCLGGNNWGGGVARDQQELDSTVVTNVSLRFREIIGKASAIGSDATEIIEKFCKRAPNPVVTMYQSPVCSPEAILKIADNLLAELKDKESEIQRLQASKKMSQAIDATNMTDDQRKWILDGDWASLCDEDCLQMFPFLHQQSPEDQAYTLKAKNEFIRILTDDGEEHNALRERMIAQCEKHAVLYDVILFLLPLVSHMDKTFQAAASSGQGVDYFISSFLTKIWSLLSPKDAEHFNDASRERMLPFFMELVRTYSDISTGQIELSAIKADERSASEAPEFFRDLLRLLVLADKRCADEFKEHSAEERRDEAFVLDRIMLGRAYLAKSRSGRSVESCSSSSSSELGGVQAWSRAKLR